MAVTYLDLNLDGGLGDFGSTTITGNGSMGTENTFHDEGSACIWGDVNIGAGQAYGEKALAVSIGDGALFHVRIHVWFNADATFPTGDPPTMSGLVDVFRLLGGGKVFALRMLDTQDGGGKFQWRLLSNASGSDDFADFSPGWARSSWHEIHIYGLVDNSAGWFQLWSEGTKYIEVTGIDFFPGASWDTIQAAIVFQADAAGTDVGFGIDGILINDDASPAAPCTWGIGADDMTV